MLTTEELSLLSHISAHISILQGNSNTESGGKQRKRVERLVDLAQWFLSVLVAMQSKKTYRKPFLH